MMFMRTDSAGKSKNKFREKADKMLVPRSFLKKSETKRDFLTQNTLYVIE